MKRSKKSKVAVKHSIIVYTLHAGSANVETAKRIFTDVRKMIPGVSRSYFARYSRQPSDPVTLRIHITTSSRVYIRGWANKIAKRYPAVDRKVVVESRGELSPLHDAIMAVSLRPEVVDFQQLADAFHWCLNAAGYNYADEIMIASGMAYTAGRSIHPTPTTAPLPYGFKNS